MTACGVVPVEVYLATYKKCLMCVSHSQDFMNTVCNRSEYTTNQPWLNQAGMSNQSWVKQGPECLLDIF